MHTSQTRKTRKLATRGGIGLLVLAILLAPLAALATQAIFQVRMDWKYKNYEITPWYGTYYTTGGGPKSGYTTGYTNTWHQTAAATTTTTTTTTPTSTVTNMNVHVWATSDPRSSYVSSYISAGTGPLGLGTTWSTACATGYYCLQGTIGTGSAPQSVGLWSFAGSSDVGRTYVLPSTYHIPGYPTATRYYSVYNLQGYFYGSHPYAATGTTTINGATNTTKSGNNYAFSRGGKIVITPGANRFGGTMRFIMGFGYHFDGKAVASVGYADYVWNAVRHLSNSGTGTGGAFGPNPQTRNSRGYASTDPQTLGQTQTYGSTQQTHTYLTTGGSAMGPLKYQFWAWSTAVPWTTGMAQITQSLGYYVTTLTMTGSDNRTASGLNGTISLVQPLHYHNYRTAAGDPVTSPYHTAWMRKVNINLLPEPAATVLLGIGILGMGALYRARKR